MTGSGENVIEFFRDQSVATVTFCQGRYISKIRKLAEKYPNECQIEVENNDGSIVAHIPVKWVRVTPPRKVELDEDRRKELAERMKHLRDRKQSDSLVESL